jgi:ribosome-associated protein
VISANVEGAQTSSLNGLSSYNPTGTVTSAASYKKMVTTERISKMQSNADLSQGFELAGRKFTPEEVVTLAIASGMEKKAQRPVALDLNRLGAFANYFAILSATNGRQVVAVAEGIRLFIKQTFGISPITVDGLETQQWVFLDYGFMFVHVFQEATREMYSLEQLWSKGQLVG